MIGALGIKVDFRDGKGGEPLRRFAAIQALIGPAIADGLNDGGDKVRTQVMRAAWKQTGLKQYKSVTSRFRTAPAHSISRRGLVGPTQARMSYTIHAMGPGIPIKEFKVKRVGAGVEASPWGVSRVFERSFQRRGADGWMPGAFYARKGAERTPFRPIYGPNLAKELVGLTRGSHLPQVFTSSAALFVPPAILKRLGALVARM